MKSFRYIAIEGCIGVGKTTLAEKLAGFRRSHLSVENFEKNPFLEEFYSDPQNNVLENSLQFLLIHCLQNKQMVKIKKEEIIADFSHHKDPIFAEVNLINKSEKNLFVEACQLLHAKLSTPDLVVFIRGDDSFIYSRILQRNRKMEMMTPLAYYAKINAAYERYFSNYNGPLLVIDVKSYDVFKSDDDLKRISEAIDMACSKL